MNQHILEGIPIHQGKQGADPNDQNSLLIEASFADAIAIIAASGELPEHTRRHWPTSLRQIAKAFDKPLEVIPARYSAVRANLAQLHEVPAGLTAKTLQNHKSNAKSALLWLAREKDIPEHGAPLSARWEELRSKTPDGLIRSRLSSFMRYCSANNIAPAEVDEAVVDRFVGYRSDAVNLPMLRSVVLWPAPGMKMSDGSRLASAAAHRASSQSCCGD